MPKRTPKRKPEERERDVDGRYAPEDTAGVKVTRNKPKRGRGRPFVKGQKRPPGAGRKKGTPNKVTKAWKVFCLEMSEDPEIHEALRQRILQRAELMLRVAEHAVGRPRETQELEHSGEITIRWED
jgi:hypothetical protein